MIKQEYFLFSSVLLFFSRHIFFKLIVIEMMLAGICESSNQPLKYTRLCSGTSAQTGRGLVKPELGLSSQPSYWKVS